jgi:hypothetical protein
MNFNIYHDWILNFIIENKIFFTIFMTIIIVRFKYLSQTNSYLAASVYFIGTFFHELAHYLIALFTTFRWPEKISLFPKIEKHNGTKTIVLGYVDINKKNLNIFNAFLIGMAPLLLLYLAYLVSKYFFTFYVQLFEINLGTYLLYLFLITTLIVNSVPSSADFKVARIKGSIYLYIMLIFIYFTYTFL